MGISKEGLFIHSFQIELEFGNVDFGGKKKTGELCETRSMLEQGRDVTTNSGGHTRGGGGGGCSHHHHHCAGLHHTSVQNGYRSRDIYLSFNKAIDLSYHALLLISLRKNLISRVTELNDYNSP